MGWFILACNSHGEGDAWGCNYERDHPKLNSDYAFEMKVKGIEWPKCFNNLVWYIHTSDDAIEVSKQLRIHFSDDFHLMAFANWLDETSKYCNFYRLDT
jgi:hypothetical protein